MLFYWLQPLSCCQHLPYVLDRELQLFVLPLLLLLKPLQLFVLQLLLLAHLLLLKPLQLFVLQLLLLAHLQHPHPQALHGVCQLHYLHGGLEHSDAAAQQALQPVQAPQAGQNWLVVLQR